MKTLSIEPNKFNSNTTKDFYTDIINNTTKNEFQLFNESDDAVRKFLSCLNVNKVPGMDQIAAKFWKAAVFKLASPLPKITHLLA